MDLTANFTDKDLQYCVVVAHYSDIRNEKEANDVKTLYTLS